ncbi:MAG: hypothetical protein ACRD2A_03760 [Vicinamibacterales bacterium]
MRQLTGVGIPASQIYVYARFQNQVDEVNYAPHLPDGVQIVAAERANRNGDLTAVTRRRARRRNLMRRSHMV